VEAWQSRFNSVYVNELPTAQAKASSDDPVQFYELTVHDAAATMYQVTGQARFITDALDIAERMMASARVIHGEYTDDFLGWTTKTTDICVRAGVECPGGESFVWRYVTKTLRVIAQTPALYDDPAIRARYTAVKDFAEVHIFQKWWGRTKQIWDTGDRPNVYRSTHHNLASPWGLIAFDLWTLPDCDPGWKPTYLEVWQHIATNVREVVQTSGVPMDVNYSPTYAACLVVGAMAEQYEVQGAGGFWTDEVMAVQIQQFAHVIWTGLGLASNVDGTGADAVSGQDIAQGYAKLGQWDPELQYVLERFATNMPPNWQLSAYFAAGALNAKRLGL
jgi:hypothetical protein